MRVSVWPTAKAKKLQSERKGMEIRIVVNRPGSEGNTHRAREKPASGQDSAETQTQ